MKYHLKWKVSKGSELGASIALMIDRRRVILDEIDWSLIKSRIDCEIAKIIPSETPEEEE